MLVRFGAPKYFWGEAILIANFVLNRVPHKKTFLTPFELWKKKKKIKSEFFQSLGLFSICEAT